MKVWNTCEWRKLINNTVCAWSQSHPESSKLFFRSETTVCALTFSLSPPENKSEWTILFRMRPIFFFKVYFKSLNWWINFLRYQPLSSLPSLPTWWPSNRSTNPEIKINKVLASVSPSICHLAVRLYPIEKLLWLDCSFKIINLVGWCWFELRWVQQSWSSMTSQLQEKRCVSGNRFERSASRDSGNWIRNINPLATDRIRSVRTEFISQRKAWQSARRR